MKRARKNFLFTKYTRGVARASTIFGTLHVRFLRARATHFARVAFRTTMYQCQYHKTARQWMFHKNVSQDSTLQKEFTLQVKKNEMQFGAKIDIFETRSETEHSGQTNNKLGDFDIYIYIYIQFWDLKLPISIIMHLFIIVFYMHTPPVELRTCEMYTIWIIQYHYVYYTVVTIILKPRRNYEVSILWIPNDAIRRIKIPEGDITRTYSICKSTRCKNTMYCIKISGFKNTRYQNLSSRREHIL